MTDYDSFTIKFAKLISRARDIRGKILDDVIFVEYVLDLIILKYFCESTPKIELFQATLLNQKYIPLDSKIKIFKNLDLGQKYSKTIKELGVDLDKAREIRNELAHRMIDNSEEAVNNQYLRLVYYEKGKRKYQQIDEKYLERNLEWLGDVKAKLAVLLTIGDFKRFSTIDIEVLSS
jgi:hypothetical protein